MGKALEALLQHLSADAATNIFITLTLGVFVLAVAQGMKGEHSRFLIHAPNIMTSLGILGTFLGIVIGLLAFDVQNIDASIGPLLAGMKTAFLTSLVGMLCSILFKALDAWKFAPARESAGSSPEEVTPAHILGALQIQNDTLSAVARSLSATEEGSVVGQLKMVRSDLTDRLNRQREERERFETALFLQMDSFAQLLSKSATEVVIEALRQVIVDFNRNLTEQFGENFKALDASVKKLVDWQAQYSIQVEQMGHQFQRSVDSIDLTGEALQRISSDCARIPTAMSELRDVLEVNQHQIQELQRHLEVFTAMRDRAIEAVPEIRKQVQHVAEQLGEAAVAMSDVLAEKSGQFADHVNSTNRAVLEMAATVSNSTDSMRDELTSTVKELESSAREMVRSLEQASIQVHNQIAASTDQMAEAVRRDTSRALTGVEEQIKQAVEKTGEGVNVQLQIMDKAVEQELERVLNRFGRSLAKISDAFSRDYEGLMSRLSEMSRRVS